MPRAATTVILIASLVLLAGSTTYAQKKFEFEVWTIFASNYKSGFGGDLLLVKKHLRRTGYSSFSLLNERKLKGRLGDTLMIPIPGGSLFAISPKAYKDKIAYIQVFLTGEDKDYNFYDPSAAIEGTVAGQAFAVQDDQTITLIGPKTKWGALIFIIHQIDL